jgi:hypothetical protein
LTVFSSELSDEVLQTLRLRPKIEARPLQFLPPMTRPETGGCLNRGSLELGNSVASMYFAKR